MTFGKCARWLGWAGDPACKKPAPAGNVPRNWPRFAATKGHPPRTTSMKENQCPNRQNHEDPTSKSAFSCTATNAAGPSLALPDPSVMTEPPSIAGAKTAIRYWTGCSWVRRSKKTSSHARKFRRMYWRVTNRSIDVQPRLCKRKAAGGSPQGKPPAAVMLQWAHSSEGPAPSLRGVGGAGDYREGYMRSGSPVYSWRGRPILVCGSFIISRHWAIQPGRRPMANSTVNIFSGKPMAL